MSAHWPVARGPLEAQRAAVPLARLGLGTLLNATAARHPERIALVDPSDKPAWSGRPAITWTYAAASEIVERLARGLWAWRLPPGSRIGLCLPGSSESTLAFLAVEAVGHVACPLPVAWDEDKLLAAAQGAGLAAVLTQARLGSVALAERLCGVAARYFGLRYLAAFGPDVPDGVINLDAMALARIEPAHAEPTSPAPASIGPAGLVSFVDGDTEKPVDRSADALVAASAAHLVALRAGPGERILSLIGQHDLRGLVTGLGAALVAGASLETLPLFDGAGFAASLSKPVPTHLVAPAFLEKNLAGRELPASLRSVSLCHRAPVRFPSRARPRVAEALRVETILDVVALGETAILSGRRFTGSDVALALARPESLALPATLMAMRREPDGKLAVRGRACAVAPLQRGVPNACPIDAWQPVPFGATLSAGIAVGVTVHVAAPDDASRNFFAKA